MRFHIVDVFSEQKYAGNQLAVFEDASDLSAKEMQKIAREVNFSETTFITSSKAELARGSFSVRIFTPKYELPFAGHPTLGTAFVLQKYVLKSKVSKVILKMRVGPIDVTPTYSKVGEIEQLRMRQKEPRFAKLDVERKEMAEVLGINERKIDDRFPILAVSTGVPFIIVPLVDLTSLRECKLQSKEYCELISRTEAKSILAYSPEGYVSSHELGVRVFTLYYGMVEDPATGSGNGCLAAYLSKYKILGSSNVKVTVDQGHELGRPSTLYLEAKPKAGCFNISVGGSVVDVASGEWP